MSEKPLTHRAVELYADEGILQLLSETASYTRNAILARYRSGVEYLKQFSSGKAKRITLNNVLVPIETYWMDRHLPYYEPPYPTASDPDYEHTEAEALRTYTSQNDDVVIIGGGLGVTTVVASRVTDGTVTTFEPSKNTFEILQRTIAVNDCQDNVTGICAAIGRVKNSNLTHARPTNSETVSPADLPDADVYEMDCEGAETTILAEMEVRPTVVLVETHDNEEAVVDCLTEAGYEIVEIVDEGRGQYHACTHVRAVYDPS